MLEDHKKFKLARNVEASSDARGAVGEAQRKTSLKKSTAEALTTFFVGVSSLFDSRHVRRFFESFVMVTAFIEKKKVDWHCW